LAWQQVEAQLGEFAACRRDHIQAPTKRPRFAGDEDHDRHNRVDGELAVDARIAPTGEYDGRVESERCATQNGHTVKLVFAVRLLIRAVNHPVAQRVNFKDSGIATGHKRAVELKESTAGD
jgi:hypothetical protein